MRLIFFLSFAATLITSCKDRTEKTSPVVQNITESVYASGIIKTKNQYQVFSTVNGLIKKILVTEGDMVKKGDPLMIVQNETARLNIDNAKLAADYASVSANQDKLDELKLNTELAKNKLDNDELQLQRQRNLWSQGIGTKNELEQRELAFKTSGNNYEAAVLRLNELKKQLNFAAQQSQKNLQISNSIAGDFIIKSEISGKVYNVLKETGETVNIQSPVAIIGDADNFLLELQVDEYDIAKIRLGQKTMVKLDSYKGQIFEATISKINPIMNDRSKSFTVEATFVTKPATLFPNLTTESNIIIQTKEQALLIPRTYLLDDDHVLMQSKEKRKITTGLKDYQQVEIVSGLTANDVILKPAK
ncbi:MAG: HlyD family efflux transporter periplasmic adaptor subunit [Ferruginibacter sp.]|uniref:efflux RND transporter periplasmic adaptor subunit n=1 Tax=Ferruginibacter sp. TaxID=1940288 RepID=UPI00265B44BF|nr:efflux RND transporter periplasmic adaptor subunit [Ferruginibacter sp.]MDB5277508.1 HlyD family efflux transporter periplasmic adaptor subunit [Ferruginibacter sp.]